MLLVDDTFAAGGNDTHRWRLAIARSMMTICRVHCSEVNRRQLFNVFRKQESSAVADKPARRERMSKIAPIGRACCVVADNTGLCSFV